MDTILFVSYNELHVTWGGVHRVNRLLMDGLSDAGYRCLYLINKEGKTFYINNKEIEENKLDINGLNSYLTEQNVRYIIDQEGIFSDSFNLVLQYLKRTDIKLLTVFHNTPCIYEKLYGYKWLLEELKNSSQIVAKVSYAIRLSAYPLWRWFSKRQISKRYRNIYSISDKVVFLSKNDIPVFREYVPNIKEDKCVAIPNALTFSSTSDASILNEKENKVLIVSRLNDNEKRISIALQIWKIIEQTENNDWNLIIVGTGPHESKLKELAQNLSLKRVSFEGHHESEPFYHTGSLFMMTSAVEGWGLTLTESMQRGVVPLVFDSYPALSDIITDGYDGCIIPDNNLELYAKRMLELMNDKMERERIARNGLESCMRFHPEKIVKYWSDLLQDL